MRSATWLALGAVLLALGAAAVVGLGLGGGGDSLTLETAWVSDTGRDVNANHHAVAVGTIDGRQMVFAPVSGRVGTEDCGLYAFEADGTAAWNQPVAPANCTIHAVADPTVADFDSDGEQEVLAATTERAVFAYDAASGSPELRANLTSYGYTRPLVADLTGDSTPEVIVVDAQGTVTVRQPDGTEVWSKHLGAYTWGQPSVADIDGDGDRELAVAIGGEGAIVVFDADGKRVWERTTGLPGGVTWLTSGQLDADPAIELVTATPRGNVVVVDGRTGDIQWDRDFGAFAAVLAVGDGDGDGTPEVYATARDGVLRALDGSTGDTEWSTTLTSADVQMTPPPTLGDVDGDGQVDLVAVTNDGRVLVVDPETGDIRARYQRDAPIFTHSTLADLDGDGSDEILVMYGDGRVVVLDAST